MDRRAHTMPWNWEGGMLRRAVALLCVSLLLAAGLVPAWGDPTAIKTSRWRAVFEARECSATLDAADRRVSKRSTKLELMSHCIALCAGSNNPS